MTEITKGYHATPLSNLQSIMSKGLLCGLRRGTRRALLSLTRDLVHVMATPEEAERYADMRYAEGSRARNWAILEITISPDTTILEDPFFHGFESFAITRNVPPRFIEHLYTYDAQNELAKTARAKRHQMLRGLRE